MILVGLLSVLTIAAPGPDPACRTTASPTSLAKRASPFDSVSFTVGAARVKICYSRPSSRGRTMLGGHNVPFGRVWRTGANEPTVLHTSGLLSVAGVMLEAGSYSLYTIPTTDEWVIILNRSLDQWGDEGSYTDAIKRQDVGRGKARATKPEKHVEQFTIRPDWSSAQATLVLEWEWTRVTVPLEAPK